MNRFDDETKQAFLELYDKVDADFVMPVPTKPLRNTLTHAPLSDIIMANSWSFLSDELNMTEHSKYYYEYDRNDPNRENPFTSDQSYWEDDGFSLTGNPTAAAQDTINLYGIRI